jgi:hypothetical protein
MDKTTEKHPGYHLLRLCPPHHRVVTLKQHKVELLSHEPGSCFSWAWAEVNTMLYADISDRNGISPDYVYRLSDLSSSH